MARIPAVGAVPIGFHHQPVAHFIEPTVAPGLAAVEVAYAIREWWFGALGQCLSGLEQQAEHEESCEISLELFSHGKERQADVGHRRNIT